MSSKPKCGAQETLEDERTITCTMQPGHDGPTHETGLGERWGDWSLPAPAHHVEA